MTMLETPQATPDNPTVTPPSEQPPAPTTPAPPAKRDLSGIDPAFHTLLERMSGDAYNRYSDLERRMAAGKLIPAEDVESKLSAAQLSDHPRGFIASPEFEKATNTLSEQAQIMDSLEQALIAMEEKKDFTILTRDAKGNLVPSSQYAASAKNKVLVGQLLSRATSTANELEKAIAKIEADHATSHKSRGKDVVDMDVKFFAQYDKIPAFVTAVEGALAELPASLKHNPMAKTLAKALAFGSILMQENEQLRVATKQKASLAGASPASGLGDNLTPESARTAAALKANAGLFGMSDA